MKRLLLCLCLCSALAVQGSCRVISLSPAMTELICHLGGGHLLVGRSAACDYPEEIRKLPVAGNFASPNLERLLSLQPTHIVTNELITPSVLLNLKQQGVQVILKQCSSVAEYRECVTLISTALHLEQAGQQELQRIDAFVRQCRSRRPVVSCALTLLWTSPLLIAGKGTFLEEMVSLAGAASPDFKNNRGYFTPALEWLFAQNPELVITFPEVGPLKQHRSLSRLAAVRQGRILVFPDSSLLQRPGPRWTQGVEQLHSMLEKQPRPSEHP